MDKVLKTCACGRSYTAEEIEKLKYVGPFYTDETAERGADSCELRDCVCKSTIAVFRDAQGNLMFSD